MNEAEKLEFEIEVDDKGLIRITDEVQKAAKIVPGSIVTIRMKIIQGGEEIPEGVCEVAPKKFEFTDELDEEGYLRVPEMVKKAAGISAGSIAEVSVEHVLGREVKLAVHKFEFVDEVDEEGRLRVPEMTKKAARISAGNILSIRLKHVLETEGKPVDLLVENVDKFDFASKVDDEGRVTIPKDLQRSIPIASGNILTVRVENILDSE